MAVTPRQTDIHLNDGRLKADDLCNVNHALYTTEVDQIYPVME